MRLKIKRGDQVEVITGKSVDKGKRGEVIRVLQKSNEVIVQDLNIRTKHQRQVQSEGKSINPGIVKLEGPIHISNVMLVCKKCNKPTRVGFIREDGKSIRICKKCGAKLD
ncbi:MAG TPA: 50S ribosomal protein L24 [Anaerolineaceae bacterium]|uniref:Large ribosomal subunit protein uL24 n=1 Tax=Anaerolinea thermophila TaxID=167964 RepID=A0A101FYS0_9CHLR|nr:MAG: 50S ribosomal protein L24 [Anaerolinea thermophila]HAF62926.1 50S ribosomal protein L24 [Anaerolineaceae bacterium]